MIYPLKTSLAEHGFSATESYDHAIRCFLSNPVEGIPCLNIDGDSGRRRTAFAHALGQVLEAQHVLYYEFGKDKAVPQIIRIQEGEEIVEEPPVEAFDRILTEACAQSEAESTVLILDQLHKTQFLNHMRLFEFMSSGRWSYSDVSYQANIQNLKVFLISDEPLYHSLQNRSFRIWIGGSDVPVSPVTASELGLDQEACPWFVTLQELFQRLRISPSVEEYRHLIFDISEQVRSSDQLKVSLFGWLENIDRQQLNEVAIEEKIDEVVENIQQSLGIEEEIEISSP